MRLRDAYNTIDNLLLEQAGNAVKAWNWTTGGTRAGAACVSNIISSGAWLIANTTPLYEGATKNLGVTILASAFIAMIPPTDYYLDRHQDEKERKASKSKLLDKSVERMKAQYKVTGGVFGALGTMYLVSSFVEPNNVENVSKWANHAAIWFGWAGRYFIMRTPYLPPGKSVFERTYDAITDAFQQSVAAPAPTQYTTPVNL